MAEVEKEIEVNLPVRAVYNQWTLFEEFPRFMEGVQRVDQLGPDRLHWVASLGGQRREWDARILDQIPDERIAWRSENGEVNAGLVTFLPADGGNRTRVKLRLRYRPEGVVETAADAIGVVSRRVDGDLHRFKEYLEGIGHEAGGWRGEIHREYVPASEPPYMPESGNKKARMFSVIAGAAFLVALAAGGVILVRMLTSDRKSKKQKAKAEHKRQRAKESDSGQHAGPRQRKLAAGVGASAGRSLARRIFGGGRKGSGIAQKAGEEVGARVTRSAADRALG